MSERNSLRFQEAHVPVKKSIKTSLAAFLESQDWNDQDLDDWITAIRMNGCQAIRNFDSAAKRVYGHQELQPDEELRAHTWTVSNCAGTTWRRKEWGILPAGKYHSTIKAFGGLTGASIPSYWRFYAGGVTFYW